MGAEAGLTWLRAHARWFRIGFGIAGFLFLGVALWTAYEQGSGAVLPSGASLFGAFLTTAFALVAGAFGWIALFDGSGEPRHLSRAFLVAQLGKYIPGGIWQVLGLGLAVGPEVSVARAATVVPTQIVIHVAAGGFIGALLGPFGTGAPDQVRALSLLGLLLLPLLHRPWLAAVAARIRRWSGAVEGVDHVPSQRAVLSCFAWDSLALLASGIGFTLLLRSSAPGLTGLEPVFAFSLAWVTGFLAVLVPAGIGVREAVLLLALRADGAAIIAASLAFRLVSMIAEALLALAAWRRA